MVGEEREEVEGVENEQGQLGNKKTQTQSGPMIVPNQGRRENITLEQGKGRDWKVKSWKRNRRYRKVKV